MANKKSKEILPTYLIFFEHVTRNTFLCLNVFIITCFICGNKYVKQGILINHSWISPILQQGWGLEFCLFSKKWVRVHFSPKTGRDW